MVKQTGPQGGQRPRRQGVTPRPPNSPRYMTGGVSRRSFLKGAGALAVLAALPGELVRQVVTRTAEAAEPHYFFDAHQYATVQALSRRLIPGPKDDPIETDPGALEANVIAYIDLFLGAFN